MEDLSHRGGGFKQDFYDAYVEVLEPLHIREMIKNKALNSKKYL